MILRLSLVPSTLWDTREKQTYTIYFKNPFLLRANHPSRQSPQKFFHAFLLLKNQNASYLYSQLPNTPHLPCHLILDAQGHSSTWCHCNSLPARNLIQLKDTDSDTEGSGTVHGWEALDSFILHTNTTMLMKLEVERVKTCSKLAQVLPRGWWIQLIPDHTIFRGHSKAECQQV